MVNTTPSRVHGKVLDLIRLRAVRDDCLCLQPVSGRATRYNRDYMAVLQVDPCNLTLKGEVEQESILESFRSFWATRTPADSGLSIHVRIRNYPIAPYLERLREGMLTQASEGYQEMARDHQAYIQHLASQKALLRREFYLRIPLSINSRTSKYKHLRAEEVFDLARSELARKEHDIRTGLARAGLMSRRLNSEELVQYYQSCLHMGQAEAYPIAQSQLFALDFPIKAVFPQGESRSQTTLVSSAASAEWMADAEHDEEDIGEITQPQTSRRWVWLRAKQIERARSRAERRKEQNVPDLMSLSELIEPASIQQSAYSVKVHHTAGDEFIRARAIIGYPPNAYAGWFDQLLSINEPGTDLVAYIDTLDPTAYVRSLSRAISGYRATQHLEQRHGRTEDPYIQAARTEVEELREKLVQKMEQVHTFSLYVYTRATDRQTLKERDSNLASLLKNLELHSVPLQFEHVQAWLALVDGRDTLRRVRKIDTSTLVASFPFCSSNLSTEPGILIGLTPGNGMLILDATSDQLENGHEAVFARSGVGKSFYRKLDLNRSLLVGFHAIAIDNDKEEYAPICEQFGGTYIRLAPGSLQLNPFDLPTVNGSEQRQVLEEKLDSLLALFDLLLAETPPGVLTQREKSYLSRLCLQVYAEHGITADPTTHTKTSPDMQGLYELLEDDNDQFGVAERLLRYLPSFPTRSQIKLDAPLVVFSLVDLPKEEASRLRAVALYLITEFVWSQVRKDAVPVPRLLLIDEAWTLMQFPDAARFLAGISRRARKYNLHLRLATQAVEDFLSSEAGRAILLNTARKFLMKQDETTIDAVANAFKLSEEERKFLISVDKGEGLYFCRGSHVPLRVVASEKERSLAETDPKVRKEQEQQRLSPCDVQTEIRPRRKAYKRVPRILLPQSPETTQPALSQMQEVVPKGQPTQPRHAVHGAPPALSTPLRRRSVPTRRLHRLTTRGKKSPERVSDDQISEREGSV